MVFYFTIGVVAFAFTMAILLLAKYGRKKIEFCEINNRKYVSYFIKTLKVFSKQKNHH